ncbi:nickel-dependent lactate racemase [archaeon SCG-AAA382B04]|nr:nickel-dependent lactate racemase [archaeon SCG-AAA382B04]
MKVLEPEKSKKRLTQREVLDSFTRLIDSGYNDLASFVGEKNSFLLVVNDNNRPTPTSYFLELLNQHLHNKGYSLFDRDLGVVVATGSHSPPSEEYLKQILGKFYDKLREDVVIHRARDGEHRFLGDTQRKTPVLVDECVFGYDCVLNINSVEPHYFAGYTGGRKSFIPGVSAWKTIEKNHRHALSPEAKALSLENNPVHQDMLDGTKLVLDELGGDVLSINSVVNSESVFDVCCGDFIRSFDELVEVANEIFTTSVREKADVVVAEVGEPLNKSLYQSLKGFENGKLITKKDGVLVLVSRCKNGVGPREFYDALAKESDAQEIIREIKDDYSLGEHKSFNLLKFLENHELFIVSEGLSDKKIEKCFCKPFSTKEEAIKEAQEVVGDSARVFRLKDAGNLVPKTR